MAKPLLPEALWKEIEPLLPPLPPRRAKNPGRKPIAHRAALTGILFVLKTGIAWEDLPREMGCGSGMTCWRRLAAWQAAGVWSALHRLFLGKLAAAGQIDWRRSLVDSSSVRALKGGQDGSEPHRPGAGGRQAPRAHRRGWRAPEPAFECGQRAGRKPDAGPGGCRRPLLGHPPPPAPARGPAEDRLYADCAYNSQAHRAALCARGLLPVIGRRGQPHGSGLGKTRWPVERTFSWLHQFGRLRIRWERRADLHEALLTLGGALICARKP